MSEWRKKKEMRLQSQEAAIGSCSFKEPAEGCK